MTEVGSVVGKLRIRRREILDGLALKNLAHEAAVHTVAGNRGRHANLVTATDPYRRGKLRGNAAEPFVAPVFRRTGFARYRLAVVDGSATAGAVGHNAFHNVGCRLGKRRIEYLFALGVGLVDGCAVGVLDGLDTHCFVLGAAVGDSGIRLRHFANRYFFRAQRNGRVCVQVGLDSALLCHVDYLVGTDFGAQLGKAGVRGNGEGAPDGTGAVVGAAVVFHLPAVDVHVARAVKVGVRRNTVVQRGKQGKRLERRTGLALCLRCQVEFVRIVIAAADKRPDVTGIRVNRNHGKLKVAGKRFQLFLSCSLSSILYLRVERGDNRHAALEHFVGRVFLQKRFTYVAGEVLVFVHAVTRVHGRRVQVQIFRLGRIVLCLGDHAIGEHAVEHQVATLLAVFGVVDGVVVRRRLGNADKRCRLCNGKVLGVFGVVALRCSLDAISALTVVNGVQVHLKDFVLRVHFFKLDGDICLAHLALQRGFRCLVGKDGIAHELLGNGGSAFMAGMGNVHPYRTGNTHKVYAVVLVETFVFRCYRALGHVRAHILQVDGVAILKVELGQQR